ncbi:MAG: hydrogenase nickel incorporation protein HypB [Akkermansia sp.]
MCKECGCNNETDETNVIINGHAHEQHQYQHQNHAHAHPHTEHIHLPILDANDRLAERNRGFFEAKNLWVINVLSSPGSGKTALLQQTATLLKGRLRIGIIVGDLATENDAERLKKADIPVIQITTGNMCHLDAGMIAQAAQELPLDDLDVLIIENVGNLVCPAAYDLGENLRVVLLSTTEGEDKPLKYPPMFHTANIAIITKMDLADATGFDHQQALDNLAKVAHHAHIVALSAKTGEGMQAWCEEIIAQRHQWQHNQQHPHHHDS